MASAPSKLATAAIVLVALWIVTYWLTPAPANNAVRISFGEPPESVAVPAPPPIEQRPAAQPEPQPSAPPVLVEVDPDEAAQSRPVEPDVVPPTFRVYTTQPGDTLQRIASRFYASTGYWRTIAKANPTVDPNRLGPGVRLYIPVDPENIQGKPADGAGQATTPPAPEPEYTEYVVQRGDTLSDISKALYGRASLWQRIVDANPGVDPNRLRPGTTLRIPPPPASN